MRHGESFDQGKQRIMTLLNWDIYGAGRGELMIAEVASRFTSVDDFTSLVNAIGFKLQNKVVVVLWPVASE